MRLKFLIPLLMLALAGIFFLNAGMSGLVIGETCCSGSDCVAENICDFQKEKAAQQEGLSFAITLLFISVMTYVILHHSHH